MSSITEQLERLSALHKESELTDEEYSAAKASVLAEYSLAPTASSTVPSEQASSSMVGQGAQKGRPTEPAKTVRGQSEAHESTDGDSNKRSAATTSQPTSSKIGGQDSPVGQGSPDRVAVQSTERPAILRPPPKPEPASTPASHPLSHLTPSLGGPLLAAIGVGLLSWGFFSIVFALTVHKVVAAIVGISIPGFPGLLGLIFGVRTGRLVFDLYYFGKKTPFFPWGRSSSTDNEGRIKAATFDPVDFAYEMRTLRNDSAPLSPPLVEVFLNSYAAQKLGRSRQQLDQVLVNKGIDPHRLARLVVTEEMSHHAALNALPMPD